jgi:hypothetical protein
MVISNTTFLSFGKEFLGKISYESLFVYLAQLLVIAKNRKEQLLRGIKLWDIGDDYPFVPVER